MQSVRDFWAAGLRFYRVTTWGAKIGWWRAMGYVFLGFLLSERPDLRTAVLDAAGIFAAFMFVFAIDDYFDWRLEDDRNFLRSAVESGQLGRREALLLCLLPLPAALTLMASLPRDAFVLGLAFLAVAGLHSIPPVRFKRNQAAGFLSSPLCAGILFLHGFSVGGEPGRGALLMAVLLAAFHAYMDLFHATGYLVQAGDATAARRLAFLKLSPAAPLLLSLAFSLQDPLFLTSSVSWLVRAAALRRVGLSTDYRAVRQAVFSPVWFLAEFAAYALIARWRGPLDR